MKKLPPPRTLFLAGLLIALLVAYAVVAFVRKSPTQQAESPQVAQVETIPAIPETAPVISLDAKESNEAAGSLSTWLVRKGNEVYLSGRLLNAIRHWELALFVDPKNKTAELKFGSGGAELERRVEDEYIKGLYAFKFLHFEQAIGHWEQVLRLVVDPGHPKYKEAQNGIAQAVEQLKRSRT